MIRIHLAHAPCRIFADNSLTDRHDRTQTVTRCDTTAGIDHVAATVGTSERSARP